MFAELIEWVMGLDPEFAFLLALPFAVAIAGFLAEGGRAREHRTRERSQPRASGVAHIGRPWTTGA